MDTWLIVVIAVVVLFILIAIFSAGDEDTDTDNGDNEKPVKKKKKNAELVDVGELQAEIKNKNRVIGRLTQKNASLSDELSVLKQQMKRIEALLDKLSQRNDSLNRKNSELEYCINSMTKIVDIQKGEIDYKKEEHEADMQFLRHTVKNMMIEVNLRLQDAKESMEGNDGVNVVGLIEDICVDNNNFIGIMNTLLYDTNMLINVKSEIDFAKSYLQMRRVNNVELVEDRIDRDSYFYYTPCIPTAISLNLIENAIKFGDRSCPDFLHIEYKLEKDTFHLSVRNRIAKSGTQMSNKFSHGVGIKNVQDRLRNMPSQYPFKLTTDSDDKYFYSNIVINFDVV